MTGLGEDIPFQVSKIAIIVYKQALTCVGITSVVDCVEEEKECEHADGSFPGARHRPESSSGI